MTTMKRIVAVLLAVMLVASIGIFSVSAAGEKLTLDATGASAKGFTFTIYQVAKLTDLNTGEYDVKATDAAVKADMETPNQSGAAFLADLDAASASTVGTSLGTLTESTKEITEPGIYYVKVTGTPSTVTKKGNSVIVWPEYANNKYTMANMTVDLSQKVNSGTDNITKYFTGEKTVESKSLSQGVTVNFTLEADVVGSVEENISKYVIWDRMCKGLTYNNDMKVYLDSADKTSLFTITQSAISDSTLYNEGTRFEIAAKAATLTGTDFYGAEKVTVTYSATVNNDATTGSTYNPNEDGLIYNTGSGNDVEKYGREVKVYTYEARAYKINGENDEPLPGATFELYDSNNTVIAEGTSAAQTGEIVFIKKGTNDKKGIKLAPGDYSIKEKTAPTGYALSTATTTFTIADDKDGTTYDNGVYYVGNIKNFPTKLPETGGNGNTLFVIIGGCLVLLAGAMFVIIMKKRASSK